MQTFPKFLLRPIEAAESVGMSRARIYRAIAEGEIESVVIGRSRRITPAALQAWIERVGRVEGVKDGVSGPSHGSVNGASERETAGVAVS